MVPLKAIAIDKPSFDKIMCSYRVEKLCDINLFKCSVFPSIKFRVKNSTNESNIDGKNNCISCTVFNNGAAYFYSPMISMCCCDGRNFSSHLIGYFLFVLYN